MTRVVVIVEGQTEESFVNDVLAEALWPAEVYLTPILLGVPGHKSGRPNYARIKKDVLLHLKQDRAACCSTMLDFYGLGPGFPGTPIPIGLPSVVKASRIERQCRPKFVTWFPISARTFDTSLICNCTNTALQRSASPRRSSQAASSRGSLSECSRRLPDS